MNSILGFLEPIEKLALKVLLWIILIPKTILRIILDPDWVQPYVIKEIDSDERERFDEYISPILLYLVVAVIPALFLSIVPKFGVEIVKPEIGFESLNRTLSFQAKANFITDYGFIQQFDWYVYELRDSEWQEIFSEVHKKFARETLNSEIISDSFYYEFSTSGEYNVLLISENCPNFKINGLYLNSNSDDKFECDFSTSEFHYTDLKIVVPENPSQNLVVDSYLHPSQISKDEKAKPTIAEQFTKELQKQSLVFTALKMLLLPLIFSILTKLFLENNLGESALRKNFYVQCYYFSPIILAAWVTFYANYFWTQDILWGGSQQVGLFYISFPLVLAFIWLLIVETNEIKRERKTGKFKSFIMALLSILIIIFVIYLSFYIFPLFQDFIRKSLIRIYPIFGVGLGLLFIILKILRTFSKK